ncbi:MAG: Acetyltransferase, GNAT family, partial [uncultured Quadrisphaera sp.]
CDPGRRRGLRRGLRPVRHRHRGHLRGRPAVGGPGRRAHRGRCARARVARARGRRSRRRLRQRHRLQAPPGVPLDLRGQRLPRARPAAHRRWPAPVRGAAGAPGRARLPHGRGEHRPAEPGERGAAPDPGVRAGRRPAARGPQARRVARRRVVAARPRRRRRPACGAAV